MNLKAITLAARARFVRYLNVLAMSLLGGIGLIYQTYPTLVSDLAAKVPPTLGILLILAFCTLVHVALSQPKPNA